MHKLGSHGGTAPALESVAPLRHGLCGPLRLQAGPRSTARGIEVHRVMAAYLKYDATSIAER